MCTPLDVANVDVDIYSWFQFERGDFLDQLGWAEQVNNSLVDSHLISVPSVGTLTAWTLSGGDSQDFSWDSYWSSYFEFVVFSCIDDLAAGSFQWFYV